VNNQTPRFEYRDGGVSLIITDRDHNGEIHDCDCRLSPETAERLFDELLLARCRVLQSRKPRSQELKP
jgi:hypothetical protein